MPDLSPQKPAEQAKEELVYNMTLKERIDVESDEFPPVHAPNYTGNKKLAIVGLAPTTREFAPFNDKTFDIWSMHMGQFILPRVDVSFEFHNPYDFRKPDYPDKQYYDLLVKSKVPCFMRQHYPEIPSSIPYPLREIVEEFGRFFTNSVSYMLALAFRNQYDEIHIFGVEMEHGTEYVDQARSVIYFIGLLMGRGVKIFIPPVCQLFKCRWLYGFETDQMDEDIQKIEARRRDLTAQLQQVQSQVNTFTQQMFQIQGAIQECDTLNRRILQTDPH